MIKDTQPLHVLIVSQYFWPEPFLINDIARLMNRRGVDVSVYTGKPNYPDGDIYPGYKSASLQRGQWDGIEILRVPLIPRKKAKVRHLLMNYFSFMANGLWYAPRVSVQPRPDVIFSFMLSPITSVIPAIWLKRQKNVPLVLWVQDLWPESVSATGFVRNRVVLFLIKRLVKWVYSKADLILVQSRAFADPISSFVDKKKIAYFPNSFLPSQINTTSMLERYKFPIKKKGHFYAVFAGNFGRAQGLETLLGAAELLADKEHIHIVMVGSGHCEKGLIKQKNERQLNNVHFVGRLPMEEMGAVFNWSDALLVTLKNEVIFNYTIPSKVQAYMSAGKPIIAALNGEGRLIIEEAEAGLCCDAGNAQQLSDLIFKMTQCSFAERKKMGNSAKAYFNHHFDMNKRVEDLLVILSEQARIEK